MAFDPVTYALCKGEIDEAVGNLEPGYTYKGSVATVSALPSSGNTKGDLWQIRADGSEYVWDGTQWAPRQQQHLTPMTTAFIDSLFT